MSLQRLLPVFTCLAALALAGCATPPAAQPGAKVEAAKTQNGKAAPRGGGYYLDDGPGDNPPADLDAIPDAVPRDEAPHRGANRPYVALNKEYVPMPADSVYKARGMASWYGRRYHGKPTSTGEPYDMYAMTAAHPTLPLPSYVRVTNPKNGKSVVVRVNDRGPFLDNRLIDLSYTAAYKLDILRGVTPVEVERVFPGSVETAALPQGGFTTAELPGEPLLQAEPVQAPSAGIFLQLGAFSSQAAAEALIAKLNQRLGKALPGVRRLQAGGLHKVQAGPYADAAAATRAAEAIQEAVGLRAYKVESKGG